MRASVSFGAPSTLLNCLYVLIRAARDPLRPAIDLINSAKIPQDRGSRTSNIGKHSIELLDYGRDDAHAWDASTKVHPILSKLMNTSPAMIQETYVACTQETNIQIASRMANLVADLEGGSTSSNGEGDSCTVFSKEDLCDAIDPPDKHKLFEL